jgi:hypothetical protein
MDHISYESSFFSASTLFRRSLTGRIGVLGLLMILCASTSPGHLSIKNVSMERIHVVQTMPMSGRSIPKGNPSSPRCNRGCMDADLGWSVGNWDGQQRHLRGPNYDRALLQTGQPTCSGLPWSRKALPLP